MPVRIIFACLPLLLLATGCEKVAEVDAPRKYAKDGIAFDYPGNWTVSEEAFADLNWKLIDVESPGDAFVMITVFGFEDGSTLREYVKSFLEEIEMPVGKVENLELAEITAKGKAGLLKGLRNRMQLSLMGVNVPHTQEFYRIECTEGVVYVVCQSAEEDLKMTGPAFKQILGSITVD